MDGEHDDQVIPDDAKKFLKDRFKDLRDPVTLFVFTKKGENDQYLSLIHI